MTHHDVREQWQRRVRAGGGAHEGDGKRGIIEDRVDSIVREPHFELTQLPVGAARENAHRQLRVITREMLSRVSENHRAGPPSVLCTPKTHWGHRQMLYRGQRQMKKSNNSGTQC